MRRETRWRRVANLGHFLEAAGLAVTALAVTAVAVTAVAVTAWAVTAWAADAPRTLRTIVYDYAVTSYCGLLTPEVELGFQRELRAVTEADGLDPDQAKALRIAGWVDADREWSNRGLGGFRAWCAEDGFAAARHFLSWAQGAATP